MTSRRDESAAAVPVVVAAGGAEWERALLAAVAAAPRRVALVKRCLDLADLLATATAGTATVAVVAAELPGLDADSVDRLRREGVGTIVVVGDASSADAVLRARLLRLGVARVLSQSALPHLVDDVIEVAADDQPDDRDGAAEGPSRPMAPDAEHESGTPGRLVTVWGPPGAPGRTTVAIGLAAEAARRDMSAGIVDADPYGSGVGLVLAVLEEVSGLLAAARLANAGRLEAGSLAGVGREVTTGLRLYTGLPRPDRWSDVRPQAFGELLTVAGELDQLVVVDTGPSLGTADQDPYATGPARDDMTRIAVNRADELVVVGSADPVGLTRLARALPEVVERRSGRALRVVVNRMRPTLGWSEKEVRYLVEGVAPAAPVIFLPEDRAAVDRALVSGRPLTECGDSALRRAIAHLADELLAPSQRQAPSGRGRLTLLRRH